MGFWQAAVLSLGIVGVLMALYLDRVSQAALLTSAATRD
jgi:hypothetical protein